MQNHKYMGINIKIRNIVQSEISETFNIAFNFVRINPLPLNIISMLIMYIDFIVYFSFLCSFSFTDPCTLKEESKNSFLFPYFQNYLQ